MADSATEDERFGDVFHFNRGLDPGFNTDLAQRALEGETVDDCRQHAHVIGGRPIHSAMGGGEPPPNVAATNHDGGLDPERFHFLDSLGDLPNNLRRDVFLRATLAQRFSAQF